MSTVPARAVEVHHSYCHQCIAVCGLLVSVDGDQIVAVRGDPDHPVTKGYTCSKGRAMGAMHHAPDRLNHPQLRLRGRLVPVSLRRPGATNIRQLANHMGRIGPVDPPARLLGDPLSVRCALRASQPGERG